MASGGRDAGAQAAGARAQAAQAAGAAGQQRRRRADFHSFIWRLINVLHLVRRLPIVSSLAGQAARDPCGGLGGGASGFSKQPFSSMRIGLLFLTKHHGLQPTSTRLLGTKIFGPLPPW